MKAFFEILTILIAIIICYQLGYLIGCWVFKGENYIDGAGYLACAAEIALK